MIQIKHISPGEDMCAVRTLFQDYADGLGIDLSFQGFAQELATLPGAYAPPTGALLLAEDAGRQVGCVALRTIEEGIGEVKRLYVIPTCRGKGVGKRLMDTLIAKAKQMRFARLRLDTLAEMTRARQLYRSLGFQEIHPYYHNPIERAVYMELCLNGSSL